MKKAVLIGALDSKGSEFLFVKHRLQELGVEPYFIDVGVLGDPFFQPDISSDEVARRGGSSLQQLREEQDRGKAVGAMAVGASKLLTELDKQGIVGGVFGMGGTAGTTVGATAMQALPIGIPKLLVSTVASGDTRPYVGVTDITMMHSVIDIAGINSLSSQILSNAAYALAGMVRGANTASTEEPAGLKPMLGMTMFGVTTPCCNRVRELLTAQGFDILVFHATGSGGQSMEALIRAGFIKGVLDITTTELADDLVGGIFSAGPTRLRAAGEAGIPQVVSVGAMDMVNFGPPDTVPPQFQGRTFYQHNPTTTLMRTTIEENQELGRRLAQKLNDSGTPTVVVFPLGGVSLLDAEGKAFEGTAEREALYQGLRETLSKEIPLLAIPHAINDPKTAELIVGQFMQLYTSTQ